MFLEGRERELHYLASNHLQPDYSSSILIGMIIGSWGGDCIEMKMSQITKKNGTG
jgi:hypothetical protein